ncbi:hypothetical protein PC118_g17338 [Phytophthora cactorum]|uniref:Uncharacterized protein n=1 Tax=Phytophthora cactorum TaxID=29920 RepID=A0A8T0YSB9_9STRA|nr:hypothetical protein PC113_g17660 [Phytophthora cactorum]KAG2897566.1 hypothetical protein PC115_g17130 [Phytophthora cactorum]KAG2969627.1 hypothetical protein PC118_g17338 [Phytophthora cactorum]
MAHIINRAFVVHQGKRALSNFGKVPCLVGSNADLDNTDSALSLATGLSCDDTREKETWQRGSTHISFSMGFVFLNEMRSMNITDSIL